MIMIVVLGRYDKLTQNFVVFQRLNESLKLAIVKMHNVWKDRNCHD
jgi:hypothetical protein